MDIMPSILFCFTYHIFSNYNRVRKLIIDEYVKYKSKRCRAAYSSILTGI